MANSAKTMPGNRMMTTDVPAVVEDYLRVSSEDYLLEWVRATDGRRVYIVEVTDGSYETGVIENGSFNHAHESLDLTLAVEAAKREMASEITYHEGPLVNAVSSGAMRLPDEIND